MHLISIIVLLSVFNPSVLFDKNLGASANREFRFKKVPSPVKDDAAANAKLKLIGGDLDAGSAELHALIDGRLPTDEDEPGANVFFSAGSSGGRFILDLGRTTNIAQVNSYSWHPNSRGPQLYKLYAADDWESIDLSPKRGVDPATRGWKFIATVSTLPQQGEDGGQYGVSVTDSSGSLGQYRYLLFDCYVTELYDNWGNTFYSEIDVVAKK
jgi:hypothetical protein